MKRYMSKITLISEFSFSSNTSHSSKIKSLTNDTSSFFNTMERLSVKTNEQNSVTKADEKYFVENDSVNPALFSFVTEGINKTNSQLRWYNFIKNKKINVNEVVCEKPFEFNFQLDKKIHCIHIEENIDDFFYLTMKVENISLLFGSTNVGVIAFDILLASDDIDEKKQKGEQKNKDTDNVIKNESIAPDILENLLYIIKRQNASIAKGEIPNPKIVNKMLSSKHDKEVSSLVQLISDESKSNRTKNNGNTKTYLFSISKKPYTGKKDKDGNHIVEEVLEWFSFTALQEKILGIISRESGLTIKSFFQHKKKNVDPHNINYFAFTQTVLDQKEEYKKHLENLSFSVTDDYHLRQNEIVKDFSVFDSVHFGISTEGVSAILCLTGKQAVDSTLSDTVYPAFTEKYLPIVLLSRFQLAAALSITEMVVNTSKKNWGIMLYDWQKYQTSTVFTCISDKMQFQKLYEICNESFYTTALNLDIRQTLEIMADAQNEKRQKYNSILLTAIPIISLLISIFQIIPFFR